MTDLYPSNYTEYKAEAILALIEGVWTKIPHARVLMTNPQTVRSMDRKDGQGWIINDPNGRIE